MADPRNDQTLILLQLHVALQMFHNKLVDHVRKNLVSALFPGLSVFESARRLARWHYQWMVTHDFLPAIVGKAMANSVYKEVLTGLPIINLKYYRTINPLGRPYIPVEFSVAAYRFGHSIARPRYTVRDFIDTRTGATVAVSSVPLFEAEPTDNNLNGHRPIPPRLKMQWSKFFNAAGKPPTARPVRQFDANLSDALFRLPATALPDSNPMSRLAVRNLLRGKKMRLPSGQQIARLMDVTPLTDEELYTDHRIEVRVPIVGNVVEVLREFDVENQDLKTLFEDPGWDGEAPLWFYILKEAEIVGRGRQMGPVGGRIVAEVLVALMQRDANSYLTSERGVEAHATRSAGPRPVHDGRPSEIRRGLVLTKNGSIVPNVPSCDEAVEGLPAALFEGTYRLRTGRSGLSEANSSSRCSTRVSRAAPATRSPETASPSNSSGGLQRLHPGRLHREGGNVQVES